MEIQELITCIVQNIQVLVNRAHRSPDVEGKKAAFGFERAGSSANKLIMWIYEYFKDVLGKNFAVAPI